MDRNHSFRTFAFAVVALKRSSPSNIPFIVAVVTGRVAGVPVFLPFEKRVCRLDKRVIRLELLWSLSLPRCEVKAGACSRQSGPGPGL